MPSKPPPSSTPDPTPLSEAGWSLDPCARSEDPGEDPAPAPPSIRYVAGGLLGRGGMGVVRVAHDLSVGRAVAIKELDPERLEIPGAAARLAREATITARLDHPGIVAVHDVGTHPDGRPYYTMRLVRGRSLARAIAETDAASRRALVRHVLNAAEAIAAAHDAGIVHRDIKPANILLGAHGETQVVDWGLAAPTAAGAPAWAALPGTATRGLVGTPAYMSPEQAAGAAPDPRHDVWSLGVTLYEVLAGRLPETGFTVSTLDTATPSNPARVDLPDQPELRAIISRATAGLDQRYAHAQEFAADLLAWFEGRRVAAHAYSTRELVIRVLRAWKWPIGVGLVGLIAVSGAVLGGWWTTGLARDAALIAEKEAIDSRREAERLLAQSWVEQAVEAVGRHERATAERLAANTLRLREDPVARGVLAAFGRATRPKVLLEMAGPACKWSMLLPPVADIPPAERGLVCGDEHGTSRWTAAGTVWHLPRGFNGGRLVSGGMAVWDGSGRTTLINPESGVVISEHPELMWSWRPAYLPNRLFIDGSVWPSDPTHPIPCPVLHTVTVQPPVTPGQPRRTAAICTDGTLIVGTTDNPDGTRLQTSLTGDQGPNTLSFTPSGRLLAGTIRGGLRVLDPATGHTEMEVSTRLGLVGRILANNIMAVASGTLGGLGFWDLESGGWLGEVPARYPRSFELQEDGTLVVFDGTLRVWTPPGRNLTRIELPVGLSSASVRGDRLVLAAAEGLIDVRRLPDGASIARYQVPERHVVKAAVLAPDRDTMMVLLAVKPSTLWIEHGRMAPVQSPRPGRRMVWLEGGILASELMGGVARWAEPDAVAQRFYTELQFGDLEAEPGGRTAVVVSAEDTVWRVGADGAFTQLVRDPGTHTVASDGRILVAGQQYEIHLHDLAADTMRRVTSPAWIQDVDLSPDGRRLAAATMDGQTRIWDMETLELVAVLAGHEERVVRAKFLPDGDLVTTGWDHTARLWDLSVIEANVAEVHAEVAAAYGDETMTELNREMR